MNKQWQLVPYSEISGKLQMALDNSLLDLHSQDPQSPSILRFYRWTPPAISLGLHQKQYPIRWNAIAQKHNLDIVRRPSGGRAVLHQGELTYAVITSADICGDKVGEFDDNTFGRKRSHREIYEYISEFLIQGFAKLGINLSYGKAGRGYIHNPSCFSTATNADLVIADGRKLIGSAQVYRHNSVLQHGSISINPNYQLLRELFQAEVPIVGYQELAWNTHKDLAVEIIDVLSQSARDYFQTEFL
ncbi:lipoate--protein ligase family protein [Phormidium tenue]|jgi:lipoate-protein ligase A|uniref:Lipoate--protein ligase family protein n=1 Tax=Phormidium tenue FACHB-1050 TaxID=2692857 RepID=A0ABR8CF94_9CYAN|nr:lipoate--protein ligase family protein [Phormidium tenue]MBD2318996.1 lipoate--protein ligase family protein [Phormidium tenue FACHB-1050]